MLYVTLAALAVAAITIVGSGSIVRSLIRQHARERERLLSQVFHAVNRPWAIAPADEGWEPPKDEHAALTASPENYVDDF